MLGCFFRRANGRLSHSKALLPRSQRLGVRSSLFSVVDGPPHEVKRKGRIRGRSGLGNVLPGRQLVHKGLERRFDDVDVVLFCCVTTLNIRPTAIGCRPRAQGL